MEWLIGIVIFGEIVLGWLLLAGREYSKEKGKNIATKEDVEDIITLIEGAKVSFSQDLEKFKHGLSIEIEYAKFISHLRFETFNKIAELKEDINRFTRSGVTGEKIDLNKSFVVLETFIKARLSILSNFDSELQEFNNSVNSLLAVERDFKKERTTRTKQHYFDALVVVMNSLDKLQQVVIDTRIPNVLEK